ncbi:MAG: sulfite exporter TauE/SafE family protein [Anaerolineae bacterium]|nr:sulfite exporter TauE/SafE family protein [Anaerolineae bacterium]
MELGQAVVLFFAAMIAGALNSVAGGGSFISFPALVATRVPEKIAIGTNTTALWIGAMSSVGAYRKELAAQRKQMILFSIPSIIGSIVGTQILLITPDVTLRLMLPFLLLFATLLFTFSPRITAYFRQRAANAPQNKPQRNLIGLALILTAQFFVAAYGGFFGAGIGIMMLAVLGLYGMENIHTMNAVKTVQASIINGISALILIAAGQVLLAQGILMTIAAIIGGYGGAHYAQKINPKHVRRFVIVVGFTLTALFFYRTFFQAAA